MPELDRSGTGRPEIGYFRCERFAVQEFCFVSHRVESKADAMKLQNSWEG